ncbi:MAG: helix-turn-helix transcriptional regulator [Actinomycetota bacterium]|nr:helix-turn-helix transcriptional regulator [Actinomycetota bacterium]MDQ2846911.1 helix-turn-helix transcriptional regulator [Actinomycetota bacterium]MDQ2958570.1 helix-turn-helix transcriptional regulator [Actinomycetota bacterium]
MARPDAFGGAAPVFVISVAAELAGMHPQTLRQYDRLGLVSPQRTAGRGRRYSPRDIEQLREVQRLSQEEGLNLAGIKRILELENEVHALRSRLTELEAERQYLRVQHPGRRVFSAGAGGIVSVPLRRPFADPSTALVVWRPRH